MTSKEFEKSIDTMPKEKVTIPLERYEKLVKAEELLLIAKKLLESDIGKGYISSDTEKYLRIILDVKE
jgi:hypothetical protein